MGAASSLVFQARLAQGNIANWNVLIVVVCYLILALEALVIWISRRRTIQRRLQTIPKFWIPVKQGDVPKPVADLIRDEYTRACVTTHLSKSFETSHPGWGTPGTQYEGVRFRTAILDTLPRLDALARETFPGFPPLMPNKAFHHHFRPLNFLFAEYPTLTREYSDLIEQARYEEDEPSLKAWLRCQELVSMISMIIGNYERYEPASTPPPVQMDWSASQSRQTLDSDAS
ncbi:hypothetical protein FRC03_001907 [Tulasnella sp. 419]|nr:hypothetical protein FRC02_000601 [Tulasnella sp. 418]KAG8944828.1 hypothetical protein FRC03_001907 [Tulasnella sp. 419]